MSDAPAASYQLPKTLITRADLARLEREVETLDNELAAQKVRSRPHGKQDGNAAVQYQLPNLSKTLNDFLELNKLDVANDHARMELKDKLGQLKDKAPIMHMTFASEADPESLQKLASWIRAEVHPQALISVGLQPSLVGGVYLRTPNHVHNFSIKALLQSKRDVMVQALESIHAG